MFYRDSSNDTNTKITAIGELWPKPEYGEESSNSLLPHISSGEDN